MAASWVSVVSVYVDEWGPDNPRHYSMSLYQSTSMESDIALITHSPLSDPLSLNSSSLCKLCQLSAPMRINASFVSWIVPSDDSPEADDEQTYQVILRIFNSFGEGSLKYRIVVNHFVVSRSRSSYLSSQCLCVTNVELLPDEVECRDLFHERLRIRDQIIDDWVPGNVRLQDQLFGAFQVSLISFGHTTTPNQTLLARDEAGIRFWNAGHDLKDDQRMMFSYPAGLVGLFALCLTFGLIIRFWSRVVDCCPSWRDLEGAKSNSSVCCCSRHCLDNRFVRFIKLVVQLADYLLDMTILVVVCLLAFSPGGSQVFVQAKNLNLLPSLRKQVNVGVRYSDFEASVIVNCSSEYFEVVPISFLDLQLKNYKVPEQQLPNDWLFRDFMINVDCTDSSNLIDSINGFHVPLLCSRVSQTGSLRCSLTEEKVFGIVVSSLLATFILKEFFALFHFDLIWNHLHVNDLDMILGLSWITMLSYFNRIKSKQVCPRSVSFSHSKPLLYWLSCTLICRKVVSGTISTVLLFGTRSPSGWIFSSFLLTKLVVLKLLWNIFTAIRRPPSAVLQQVHDISLEIHFPEYRVDKRSLRLGIDFYWLEYLYGKITGLWYARYRVSNAILAYFQRWFVRVVFLMFWLVEMCCVELSMICTFVLSLNLDLSGANDIVRIGHNYFQNQSAEGAIFIFVTCTIASMLARLMSCWMQTYHSFKILKSNSLESFSRLRTILIMMMLNPRMTLKIVWKAYSCSAFPLQVYCSHHIEFWRILLILCRAFPLFVLCRHKNEIPNKFWGEVVMRMSFVFLFWDAISFVSQLALRNYICRGFVLKFSNLKFYGRSLRHATRNKLAGDILSVLREESLHNEIVEHILIRNPYERHFRDDDCESSEEEDDGVGGMEKPLVPNGQVAG
eukprot:TRINITY_DN24026_c0_g1_i1.p1 TRINITY_DN24026_c0_g1~~TRINITY_DN24026_c0_g1_i1.p1  ORF type:complete len:898 (+),score=156.00 TRINITY_DN24026_c0_g1_i1:36-2729(+)